MTVFQPLHTALWNNAQLESKSLHAGTLSSPKHTVFHTTASGTSQDSIHAVVIPFFRITLSLSLSSSQSPAVRAQRLDTVLLLLLLTETSLCLCLDSLPRTLSLRCTHLSLKLLCTSGSCLSFLSDT